VTVDMLWIAVFAEPGSELSSLWP